MQLLHKTTLIQNPQVSLDLCAYIHLHQETNR